MPISSTFYRNIQTYLSHDVNGNDVMVCICDWMTKPGLHAQTFQQIGTCNRAGGIGPADQAAAGPKIHYN